MNQKPVITFSGYFRGPRDKEATLAAYTTFSDASALSVLENKDYEYNQYSTKYDSSKIARMDNCLSIKHMVRLVNDEDNTTTFITTNCSRFGEKEYRYMYSVYIIIVDFEDRPEYDCGSAKLKSICFNNLMTEYEAHIQEIEAFKDIGFGMLDNER